MKVEVGLVVRQARREPSGKLQQLLLQLSLCCSIAFVLSVLKFMSFLVRKLLCLGLLTLIPP